MKSEFQGGGPGISRFFRITHVILVSTQGQALGRLVQQTACPERHLKFVSKGVSPTFWLKRGISF